MDEGNEHRLELRCSFLACLRHRAAPREEPRDFMIARSRGSLGWPLLRPYITIRSERRIIDGEQGAS
jgi:hypothetical protein